MLYSWGDISHQRGVQLYYGISHWDQVEGCLIHEAPWWEENITTQNGMCISVYVHLCICVCLCAHMCINTCACVCKCSCMYTSEHLTFAKSKGCMSFNSC